MIDFFKNYLEVVITSVIAIILIIAVHIIFPNTSDLLMIIIQAISVIAVAVIAEKTFKINKSLVELTKLSLQTKENALSLEKEITGLRLKPLLSLNVANSNCWKYWDTWYISNCSEFAAQNIYVRYFESNSPTNWVACNSISKRDIELFWVLGAIEAIEVCYSDIKMDKYYLSITRNGISKTQDVEKENYEKIENTVQKNKLNISLLSSIKNSIEKEMWDTIENSQKFMINKESQKLCLNRNETNELFAQFKIRIDKLLLNK